MGQLMMQIRRTQELAVELVPHYQSRFPQTKKGVEGHSWLGETKDLDCNLLSRKGATHVIDPLGR